MPREQLVFELRISDATRVLTVDHAEFGALFEAPLADEQQARLEHGVLYVTAPGRIAISGRVRASAHSATCRISVPAASRVLQTGIGAPDTGLNDTVYDPDTDIAVRFEAQHVRLCRQDSGEVRVTASGRKVVRVLFKQNHLRSFCPHLPPGKIRVRSPAPTGWLSYYCHFEAPSETAILEDLDVAAGLVDYGLSFFLVEAWQKNAWSLPVRNFYHEAECDREKFPHGMKWLARRIRSKGLTPGLWAVALGTGNPAVFEAHPEMFIRDASGRPIQDWSGVYMFDPTHAGARAYIARQLRTLAEDWGYDFFKLDGLSGRPDHYCEWFYSQPFVRARFARRIFDPFKDMIKLIRRTLGSSRYFHACAADYHGSCAGISDGARTGGDVFFSGQTGSWGAITLAAGAILEALFTNRYVWHVDPDILSVRPSLKRVTQGIHSARGRTRSGMHRDTA